MKPKEIIDGDRSEIFNTICRAYDNDRPIVPLLGSGVSVDAGIPTSATLASYIVCVHALSSAQGDHCSEYLRRNGWPHRHDIWGTWHARHAVHSATDLEHEFTRNFNTLYRLSVLEELRDSSPLLARAIERKHIEIDLDGFSTVDYRSLLRTVTQNDPDLIDAFFDHFVRNRKPSETHQFIAFIAQLFDIRLILTTNFDSLIEEALRNEGITPTVYEIQKEAAVPSHLLIRQQPVSLIKLHGGTHLLRTGYDLDSPMPFQARTELLSYLGRREGGGAHGEAPLIVVLGYGGADRRVMDFLQSYLVQIERPQSPALVWVGRREPPELLKEIARASMSHGRGSSVYFCRYRDAHRFLQELYQFRERQHAVSRTSYRAIFLAPREARRVGSGDTVTVKAGESRLYWAERAGLGTSSALREATLKAQSYGVTPTAVWIDAENFSARASLVMHAVSSFKRNDRALITVHRPAFIQDVDLFGNIEDEGNERVMQKREDDVLELLLASMRRDSYIVAVDSLGEFGSIHPSYKACPTLYAAMESQGLERRRQLYTFIGRLFKRSQDMGQSRLLAAYTQSAAEEPLQARDAMLAITGGELSKYGVQVMGNSGNAQLMGETNTHVHKSRSAAALAEIEQLLNTDRECKEKWAGRMVVLATLLRRPRSYTALSTIFTRFHKIIEESDVTQGDLLKRADDGLGYIEDARFGQDGQWRLLSRLEGGFYWMHNESRDLIYRNFGRLMGVPDVATAMAKMYDEISKFGRRDVFDRSHDASVFVEYMHYRLLSICWARTSNLEGDPWIGWMSALVDAVEGEIEGLIARECTPELYEHMTRLVTVIRACDDRENDETKWALSRLMQRALAVQAQICAASGYSRRALGYSLLQAQVVSEGQRLGDADLKATRSLLAGRCMSTMRETAERKVAAMMKTGPDEAPDAIMEKAKIAMSIGRNLVERTALIPFMAGRDRGRPAGNGNESADSEVEVVVNGALRIFEKCEEKVRGLDGENIARSQRVARRLRSQCNELHGEAIGRQQHIRLNAAIAQYRFGWIGGGESATIGAFGCAEESDGGRQQELLNVAIECERATNIVRSGPATRHGHRVQSFLYSLRALAYGYRGNWRLARVNLRRSQAVLRRPHGPSERCTLGIAMIVEAELGLIDKDVLAAKDGGSVIRIARATLDRALSLLAEGRSDFRWRAYVDIWQARLWLAEYYLSERLNEKGEQLLPDLSGEELLVGAMRHAITAKHNADEESDQYRLALRVEEMVDKVARRASLDFQQRWLRSRRWLGLREEPEGSIEAREPGQLQPNKGDLREFLNWVWETGDRYPSGQQGWQRVKRPGWHTR